uniref:Macaca fascicularis brain cDNA clone: QflA-18427, similar to human erythrocyte membrane protein band 4.1 (elliptocytosis 1,RH-linked) (EPB41), transcript variant 3, mRNA, RefSeq: NM_004437.2 n=1 Tax=Macaca fascicularis TaxID=9541 RepID=I7G5S4_MACFA|nr:unnamed protein product [Macaca fascicularis]
MPLFVDEMTVCVEQIQEFEKKKNNKNLLELISDYSKAAGCKAHIKKLIAFR